GVHGLQRRCFDPARRTRRIPDVDQQGCTAQRRGVEVVAVVGGSPNLQRIGASLRGDLDDDTITGDVPGIRLARGIRGTAARRKQGSNDEQTATQTECGPPTRAGTCSALRDWVGDGTSKCGADAPSAHVSWRLVRQVRSSSAWVEMDAVPV